MYVFTLRRRWSVLFAVMGLTFGLLAIIPAASATTGVFTDVSTFETATGAGQMSWPDNTPAGLNNALPIQQPFGSGLGSHSCANGSLVTPGGEATVTNPTGSYICYIGSDWGAALTNTNPKPRAATIVNNGEDDYVVSIKLSVPTHAVGISLLTNKDANETITLTYEDGTSEVFTDSVLDTAVNAFEFVGFNSTMQITNVAINTTGGGSQNEGIEGIWLATSLPTTSCPSGQYFVDSKVNSTVGAPITTAPLVDGHMYDVTASGTYYAGGAGVYDIQADAEYSQDRYARANGLGWTDAIGGTPDPLYSGGPYFGNYDETVLDLFIGGVALDWGAFSADHSYTVQRMGAGSPAVISFAVYDTYPSNNVGGLCVSLTMLNRAPVADANGPYLGAQGAAITFDGTGSSDPDGDVLTYDWDFGDSTTPNGTGANPTHAYSSAGIYDVCLTVDDNWGGTATDCTTAVVYDPAEGFVTGGGWIYSDAGNYMPDLSLEGKATFGFISKYKKGASVPTGNTEFQFHAGDLNFHSTSYDWLVVTGSNFAKFKGEGTINGEGTYKFQIWAGDQADDTFRIKIWTEDGLGGETVVYDNGTNQEIGAGSIVIHTKKK